MNFWLNHAEPHACFVPKNQTYAPYRTPFIHPQTNQSTQRPTGRTNIQKLFVSAKSFAFIHLSIFRWFI